MLIAQPRGTRLRVWHAHGCKSSVAVFAAILLSSSACALANSPADPVFLGGIYTVDAARSWASALAITGDRITYVGTDQGADAFIGAHTRIVRR